MKDVLCFIFTLIAIWLSVISILLFFLRYQVADAIVIILCIISWFIVLLLGDDDNAHYIGG